MILQTNSSLRTIDVIQLKSQGKRYPHYVVALSLTLFLLQICFLLTKNIDIITQLVGDIKKDVTLRYERLQINCVSKLSQLLSFIVVGAILFMLLSLAVMFVSMMVASALEGLIGSQTASYAIIVAFYVILGVIIYANKKRLVIGPLTNFIANLFLDEKPAAGKGSDVNSNKQK